MPVLRLDDLPQCAPRCPLPGLVDRNGEHSVSTFGFPMCVREDACSIQRGGVPEPPRCILLINLNRFMNFMVWKPTLDLQSDALATARFFMIFKTRDNLRNNSISFDRGRLYLKDKETLKDLLMKKHQGDVDVPCVLS